MTQNKALWIFPNIKESVDMLPQKLRGQAWEMIINYSFGDENVEQNCKNLKVLLAFRVVKPLLRLRGIAGSQNGKSNNPSGLAKNSEPNITPNIGANITPNSLNNKNRNNLTETKNDYAYNGEVIKLNQKDYNEWKEKFNLLDFDYELEKRDIWLSGQENTKSWFISTKQYFLGLQRKKEKAKKEEARLMSNWWRE